MFPRLHLALLFSSLIGRKYNEVEIYWRQKLIEEVDAECIEFKLFWTLCNLSWFSYL